MADHPGTTHAVWVANGNCTAVNVELVVIDTQLVATLKHLHRKGLIQLPKADVVD